MPDFSKVKNAFREKSCGARPHTRAAVLPHHPLRMAWRFIRPRV
jgi:hypothetical protein